LRSLEEATVRVATSAACLSGVDEFGAVMDR
jgi:hypothetical protein